MKSDIILAGVGGQGILTIAAVVGRAAVANGLNVKQSEVHGMAQRGGAVVAHLRLSSDAIFSDLIPLGTADVVLAVEPMEGLRQGASLCPSGVMLANSAPVENIPDYPPVSEIIDALSGYPRRVILDAGGLAREAGTARAMNMVMLGALAPFVDLPSTALADTIRAAFARKGDEVVNVNLRAFESGKAKALEATAP